MSMSTRILPKNSSSTQRLFIIALTCATLLIPGTTHALAPIDGDDGGGGGGASSEITLTATPTTIQQGYATRLSWSGLYVTSCSINQGVGAVTASGYRNVSPTSTVTYTITCYAQTGGSVTDAVTVTVTSAAAPVSVTLTANPNSIPSGSSSVLSWGSSNATSCSLNQGIGLSGTSGSRTVVLTSSTSYTITCSGAGGTASATATVTVTEPVSAPATAGYKWTPVGVSEGPVCTDNILEVTGGDDHRRPPTCSATTRGTRYSQYDISNGTCMAYMDATGIYYYGYDISWQEYVCESIPDLTASSVTPGTATAGTAKTFSATVTNSGDMSSGTTATRFQRATSAAGAGATTVADVTTSSLTGSGSTRSVSTSYTWPTEGTYYMRACADVGGAVAESNESNNCGAWTPVTVTAAAQPLSATCEAIPATAQTGDTVQWTSSAITGSGSNLTWVRGTSFTTKVCSGGQSYESLNSDCPEFINAGSQCSVEGQRCKESAGCDGATYTDGEGQPNAHTQYGSVTPYTCTASTGAVTYTYSWSGTDGLSGSAQSVNKTYGTSGQKTGTVTVTSSAGGSATATCSTAITARTYPNLTAGSVTPATATAGVSRTFSSTISNTGAQEAATGFTVLWQRATSASGASATDVGTSAVGALSMGGNISTSRSITLAAGTWYLRTCADKTSSANAGVITESNENDNCGAWTAVTVTPATPPSVSCTVSPSSITPGQSVTYRANPADGASTPYTWVASDGASVGTGATVTRTLATPGTYAMNVRASGTAVSYCPNVSVTANWCTTSTPNLTLTATPSRVRSGQSVALAWSATGVNGQNATCTVSGPGVSWSSAVTTSPSCSTSGSANTTIQTQSTYTLTCNGVSESVTVNVIPNFEEF